MNLKKLAIGLATLAVLLVVPMQVAKSATEKGQVVVSADNLLVVNGVIDEMSMGDVIVKAKQLDAKLGKLEFGAKKPIYLFLNTPGGSIQTGLEFIEALKGLGRPVHTVTLFAASMGFQLAQNFDTRYILKNGILMSHRAAGQMSGSFGGPSPSQMESRYGIWLRRMSELDNQTVSRTKGKQTLASYQKAYADELWVTGSESVAQGYADEVATIKCDKSLSGATTHTVTLMGIVNVDFDIDNCPINTNPMNIKISLLTNRGKMPLNEFVSNGGSFDAGCMYQANKDKLCTVQGGFSAEGVTETVNAFKRSFLLEKKIPLPYTW